MTGTVHTLPYTDRARLVSLRVSMFRVAQATVAAGKDNSGYVAEMIVKMGLRPTATFAEINASAGSNEVGWNALAEAIVDSLGGD